MQTTYTPLAALLANAQAAEAHAAKMPRAVWFKKLIITAFPTLAHAPEVWATQGTIAAFSQWTFVLSGVEFLVQWHAGRGGYWVFTAWDACHKLSERDSFAFAHPSVDTALCAFAGDVLASVTACKEGVAA